MEQLVNAKTAMRCGHYGTRDGRWRGGEAQGAATHFFLLPVINGSRLIQFHHLKDTPVERNAKKEERKDEGEAPFTNAYLPAIALLVVGHECVRAVSRPAGFEACLGSIATNDASCVQCRRSADYFAAGGGRLGGAPSGSRLGGAPSGNATGAQGEPC